MPNSPRKLFAMGLFTVLLNPKVAVLYLALLPQFIDPAAGSVLTQSIMLGLAQIAVSFTGNTMIVVGAGSVTAFLASRPLWLKLQRWLMGTVLAGLALRMAFEAKADVAVNPASLPSPSSPRGAPSVGRTSGRRSGNP